ncbi:unnamed protein product [Nesidiocoris tenuis]|uniref:ATP-grasp fold succinyl-CoA synthetase-type domain-containing protein n=1 Tax=Nesidiocoris tenuis TaxID=355587 RepID=A0A6H5H5L3_9HEMI|nr:unnamed protein product [Nesidiocoris tenuis]
MKKRTMNKTEKVEMMTMKKTTKKTMKETKSGLPRADEDGDEEDDKEDVREEEDYKEDVRVEEDDKEDMDASCRNSNLPIKQLPLGKYARSSERRPRREDFNLQKTEDEPINYEDFSSSKKELWERGHFKQLLTKKPAGKRVNVRGLFPLSPLRYQLEKSPTIRVKLTIKQKLKLIIEIEVLQPHPMDRESKFDDIVLDVVVCCNLLYIVRGIRSEKACFRVFGDGMFWWRRRRLDELKEEAAGSEFVYQFEFQCEFENQYQFELRYQYEFEYQFEIEFEFRYRVEFEFGCQYQLEFSIIYLARGGRCAKSRSRSIRANQRMPEGLTAETAGDIAVKVGLADKKAQVTEMLLNLYKLFLEKDALLIEINPYAEDSTGDCKIFISINLKFV